MTDSRDTTENSKNSDDNVDMDSHYENLAAYVLDALDQGDERESVESLIENDPRLQPSTASLQKPQANSQPAFPRSRHPHI
jgi:hypothetical protein